MAAGYLKEREAWGEDGAIGGGCSGTGRLQRHWHGRGVGAECQGAQVGEHEEEQGGRGEQLKGCETKKVNLKCGSIVVVVKVGGGEDCHRRHKALEGAGRCRADQHGLHQKGQKQDIQEVRQASKPKNGVCLAKLLPRGQMRPTAIVLSGAAGCGCGGGAGRGGGALHCQLHHLPRGQEQAAAPPREVEVD